MLELIIGRAGTGKTQYCFDSIQKLLEKNTRSILILPEHMTHKIEMTLAELLQGYSNVTVCGFRKFSELILDEAGGLNQPRLNELGRNLLLRKILNKIDKNILQYYSSHTEKGFTEKLSDMLREFQTYRLTPEILQSTADKISDTDLSNKLHDFALLSDEFLTDSRREFTSNEDILDNVSELIKLTNFTHDAEIFIDGFVFFNPQEKKIVEELLKNSLNMHVTLTMNPDKSFSPENHVETGIFFRTHKTSQWLGKISSDLDIKIQVTTFEKNHRAKNKAIEHLEKNLYARRAKIFETECDSVTIFEADNRYNEISACAGDILRLCREEGYRYRDISILLRDFDTYGKILPQLLDSLKIPYFFNVQTRLMKHPLATLILSTLKILHGWQYEPVFATLRTGFFAITNDEIDKIENDVIENSNRGSIKNFLEPIQDRFVEPLMNLQMNLRSKKIIDKVTAIYDYLDNLQVTKTLDSWMNEPKKENEHRLAWNWTVDLLDQLTRLNMEKISEKEFEDFLFEGFSMITYRTIPAQLDEVSIEPFDQNTAANTKMVYVLGFDEENFPRRTYGRGLLTDAERTILSELGLEIHLGVIDQALSENYLIYRGLTQARDRLWISYPNSDNSGTEVSSSSIADRLKRIFPRRKNIDVRKIFLPTAENQLATMFRRKKDGELIPKYWNDIYNFNMHSDTQFRKDLSGLFYQPTKSNISPNIAQKIYTQGGKIKGSVTEYETFSRCPFKHFVKYGMKLEPRKEFEFKSLDLGTLLHAVLSEYGNRLKNRSELWKDQNEETATKDINEILEKLAPKIDFLNVNSQGKYQLEKIKRILIQNILRLIKFDSDSKFFPTSYEEKFSLKRDSFELEGKIDRIDVDNAEKSFLILDYKTRDTELESTRIYWGLQLQLLTYVLASQAMNRKSVAGALYVILRTTNVKVYDTEPTLEDLKNQGESESNMRGWLDTDRSRDIDPNSKYVKIGRDNSKTLKTAEDFSNWLKYVEKKLTEIGNRIISGEIEASPYRIDDENACSYCDYRDICRFEMNVPGFEYRDLEEVKNLKD